MSLPTIDEFLQSVLSVSPGGDSTDALVSSFCDNSPQSVYKLMKSRSRANTVSVFICLYNGNTLTSEDVWLTQQSNVTTEVVDLLPMYTLLFNGQKLYKCKFHILLLNQKSGLPHKINSQHIVLILKFPGFSINCCCFQTFNIWYQPNDKVLSNMVAIIRTQRVVGHSSF